MNFLNKRILVFIGFFIVVIFCLFFFRDKIFVNFFTKEDKKEIVQIDETTDLHSRVNKIFFLPKEELPVIATVVDPEKLQDQIFFENSKKGDKVLIYKKMKKAVLFDPISGKIINIAPLNTNNIEKNQIQNSNNLLEF